MVGWNMKLKNSIEKRHIFLRDRVGGRINAINGWQNS